MAKRFTATEIWGEDWFLDMPIEYKLFWYYMLSTCDHAGLFKVNLRSFCGLNGVKLGSKEVLEYFNSGKTRIRVISHSIWFIEDFFVYQYGPSLNPKNRVHESILKLYNKYNINLTSIRGLVEVNDRVKDKDKDKDNKIDIVLKTENSENENVFWFLKFYHSDYNTYKKVFNGQSTTEEFFNQWKDFISFIYEKKYEDIFYCKFPNPHDFAKLVTEHDFKKESWDETLKSLLSTGVKPEHNLFFRIPQFMKYGQKERSRSDKRADTGIGRTIKFDKA